MGKSLEKLSFWTGVIDISKILLSPNSKPDINSNHYQRLMNVSKKLSVPTEGRLYDEVKKEQEYVRINSPKGTAPYVFGIVAGIFVMGATYKIYDFLSHPIRYTSQKLRNIPKRF